MSEPKVGIVIVTWNNKNFALSLLNQLLFLEYPNFETLLVDNASTDGTVIDVSTMFPKVTILINPENLGGTGGFNAGLTYFRDREDIYYIWLLDNDSEIETSSLRELVKVMEAHPNIALTGSMIRDIDCKSTIVEAGAMLCNNKIGVKPLFRNMIYEPDQTLYDVDYVATCSALIKRTILSEIGLMDQRFFLFWDDMELGWRIKNAGYRVVCVTKSVVYHPSFTERKRGIATELYYGVRNPLLVYSKHGDYLNNLIAFYRFLRGLFSSIIFLYFKGDKTSYKFMISALSDFVFNRWYKCRNNFASLQSKSKNSITLLPSGKYLLIAGSNCKKTLLIEKFISNKSHIYLLLHKDREDYFKDRFENIIFLKPGTSHISIFVKLLLYKFNGIIAFDEHNPYNFAAPHSYIYNEKNNCLEMDNNAGFKKIHQIVISSLAGIVLAAIFLPIVFTVSLGYKFNIIKNN